MIVSNDYPPPDIVVRAITAATTRLNSRVEIYEADGVTRWAYDKVARLIEGSVSVDYSRDERRTLDLTLDNSDSVLLNSPGYFWYDKIIKVYKQVRLRTKNQQKVITGPLRTNYCRDPKPVALGTASGSLSVVSAPWDATRTAYKATGNGASTPYIFSNTATRAFSSGEKVTVSANVRIPPHCSYLFRVHRRSDNTYFGGVAYINGPAATNLDTRLTHTVTLDSSTAAGDLDVALVVTDQTTGSVGMNGVSFYMNDVLIEGGDSVKPYFDGDTTQVPTASYAWSGTANNSESTYSLITWQTVPGFDAWEYQVGEFMIDSIDEDHFPFHTKITGRDYTKKCLTSKFVVTTEFTGPNTLEGLIDIISANAGITKKILPVTSITVLKSFTFERGISRWEAMKKIANAYNYDVFFDNNGYLRMQLFADPATQSPVYVFKTGLPNGNLISYSKATDDTRLYNHVLVVGATPDDGSGLAPWAEAKNTAASSPTSIDAIGDRLYEFDSEFIDTTDQAQAVADSFLAVHQLEQFNLDISALNVFYLDVGQVVEWDDPRPAPNDPKLFLLQSLTIPVGLGPMGAQAGRVTNVGGT